MSAAPLFVLAALACASPAVVQTKTCTVTGATVTSNSCSFTGTPSTSNTVLVAVTDRNGGYTALWSISDNQGNTYTVLSDYTNCSAGCVRIAAVANPTASGTFTVTATMASGSSWPQIMLIELSGMPSTLQLDVATNGSYGISGLTVSCPTITTTNGADIVISGVSTSTFNSTDTVSANAPFTLVTSLHVFSGAAQSAGVADDIVVSSGTFTPKFTFTANPGSGGCANAALKYGAASPATVRHRVTMQ